MSIQQHLASRVSHIDASGIRKVFDLAAKLDDPVNLSIGQPDFDVAEPAKQAAIDAIRQGHNGYTVTQGIPALREALQARTDQAYQHDDRQVLVTSGTSGGLLLAILCLVEQGDEVVLFDPCFVMYKHLVTMAGGTSVFVDTYPDFRIDVDKVDHACTDRTKCIVVNSPANPTGAVAPPDVLRDLADLARRRNIVLISDEVYRSFTYDQPFHSMAEFHETCLVLDGFSKAYGMTGWRLGYAHGPGRLIQEMAKLQQFSFVCAPSMVQHAGVAALELDLTRQLAQYRHKRDLVVEGLDGRYDLVTPAGAFYAFPRAPWGTATEFVSHAIRNNLLIIPGNVFSERDTHFRISYAASDDTIRRGTDLLLRLADPP